MNDKPRRREHPNPRTVALLVAADPYEPDVTRTGALLSTADMRRIRAAKPADIAQASLILAGKRDAALARYEDKRRLMNDLLHPYDDGHSDIPQIVARMMADEHAEAVDIAGRLLRQPAELPSDITAIYIWIHRLARIEQLAREFASSDHPQPAKDEAQTLVRLAAASKALLQGEPTRAHGFVTADEAAAKMHDLNERYPAEPAA
jgi:hypothetical protein